MKNDKLVGFPGISLDFSDIHFFQKISIFQKMKSSRLVFGENRPIFVRLVFIYIVIHDPNPISTTSRTVYITESNKKLNFFSSSHPDPHSDSE
jgi:hypothetical protein